MADDRLIYIYIYIFYIYIYIIIIIIIIPYLVVPTIQFLKVVVLWESPPAVPRIFFILYSFVIPCIVYISIYIYIYIYIHIFSMHRIYGVGGYTQRPNPSSSGA
jgi:hypothetical protein